MKKWTRKEVLAMANRLLNTRHDASSAEVMRNAASMFADIARWLPHDPGAVKVPSEYGVSLAADEMPGDAERWKATCARMLAATQEKTP